MSLTIELKGTLGDVNQFDTAITAEVQRAGRELYAATYRAFQSGWLDQQRVPYHFAA